MKVIITGTTGMVGEGILLECLDLPQITEMLSVSRKPTGLWVSDRFSDSPSRSEKSVKLLQVLNLADTFHKNSFPQYHIHHETGGAFYDSCFSKWLSAKRDLCERY